MAKTRVACGFVLLRRAAAGHEYLLLNNRKRDEPGLPKGHAEKGEDELETALRETREETGLGPPDIVPNTGFRRVLEYPAQRSGKAYHKRVVYFLATWQRGEVVLSPEHDRADWLPLADATYALPYPNLRGVLREAALFAKDPALFELEPWTEVDADAHLAALPHATPDLLGHLRGGARIARVLARALAETGAPVHIEATAAGTLLHDVGRAIGEHADHPRAGLRHLRGTPYAAYAFATISHFTKGARPAALVEAGVDADMLAEVGSWIDLDTLTDEERCAAVADACMKGTHVVHPDERFADLRARYDAPRLIDLQEGHTRLLRDELADRLGHDPLSLLGLA